MEDCRIDRRGFVLRSARWLAGGTVLSFVIAGCGEGDDNPIGSNEQVVINFADEAYAALNQVGGAAKVPRQDGQPFIVVRRAQNTFIAYSSRCTHTGCEVDLPDNNEVLVCPCHGSRYDIDGRRLSGPAREDLPSVKIEVSGEEATLIP